MLLKILRLWGLANFKNTIICRRRRCLLRIPNTNFEINPFINKAKVIWISNIGRNLTTAPNLESTSNLQQIRLKAPKHLKFEKMTAQLPLGTSLHFNVFHLKPYYKPLHFERCGCWCFTICSTFCWNTTQSRMIQVRALSKYVPFTSVIVTKYLNCLQIIPIITVNSLSQLSFRHAML